MCEIRCVINWQRDILKLKCKAKQYITKQSNQIHFQTMTKSDLTKSNIFFATCLICQLYDAFLWQLFPRQKVCGQIAAESPVVPNTHPFRDYATATPQTGCDQFCRNPNPEKTCSECSVLTSSASQLQPLDPIHHQDACGNRILKLFKIPSGNF